MKKAITGEDRDQCWQEYRKGKISSSVAEEVSNYSGRQFGTT